MLFYKNNYQRIFPIKIQPKKVTLYHLNALATHYSTLRLLQNINVSKALGIDNISVKFLKISAPVNVISSLTQIFNPSAFKLVFSLLIGKLKKLHPYENTEVNILRLIIDQYL